MTAPLKENETCIITIRVGPGPAGHAQLVIHQNLTGPPSIVELDVDASVSPDPEEDLDLLFSTGPTCSLIPVGDISGYKLVMNVSVWNSGPSEPSQPVLVTAKSDTQLTGAQSTDVTATGPTDSTIQVPLPPDAFGRTHHFTITADPDNGIVERDESNNALQVNVDLPDQSLGPFGPPAKPQKVVCVVP